MKHYLFFDTETTGLPKDFKIPRYVVSNWPRLVQLSWIVTDENGNRLKSGDHIIRPSGLVIYQDGSFGSAISAWECVTSWTPKRWSAR